MIGGRLRSLGQSRRVKIRIWLSNQTLRTWDEFELKQEAEDYKEYPQKQSKQALLRVICRCPNCRNVRFQVIYNAFQDGVPCQ